MANLAPQRITSAVVEDAWQAYAAMQRAARDMPALTENAFFLALQDTAFARFILMFEAMEVDPDAAERFLRGRGQ